MNSNKVGDEDKEGISVSDLTQSSRVMECNTQNFDNYQLRVETEEVDWDDTGEEEEDARVELRLIGKIWTNRHINANAFITTMTNVWQPKHGVEIRSIGKNLFVFQFFH